jgi:selenocysteine lyase/cysteine desulfurase
MTSRRTFLGALGASAAVGALPSSLFASPAEWSAGARGLADAGDFAFEPGLVYVQTGSLGPSPRSVREAAHRAWEELQRNPTAYGYGAHEQNLDVVRAQAAQFIGAETREVSLTTSTTDGLNRVVSAIAGAFERGDRVLTTDQEHPGGRSCWEWLARTRGIVIDEIVIPPGPVDPEAFVAQVHSRLTPRTRALSMAHVLPSTGVRMPVREVCAAVRERGVLAIIDGAQVVGGIGVDVHALDCDVYATSGHKWLLGPPGTGLLYVRTALSERIPLITRQQGEAAYTGSTGVTNLPGMYGLGAALTYHTTRGVAATETHNLALRDAMRAELRTIRGLEVVTDDTAGHRSPMVSYRLPAATPAGALQQRLHQRHQVYVKVVPGNWFNGHRLSFHLFNEASDVQAVARALRAELS